MRNARSAPFFGCALHGTCHLSVGEERPFLDGLGSCPALFILYYVKPNPLFQALRQPNFFTLRA
jgi:hypothetical protein